MDSFISHQNKNGITNQHNNRKANYSILEAYAP